MSNKTGYILLSNFQLTLYDVKILTSLTKADRSAGGREGGGGQAGMQTDRGRQIGRGTQVGRDRRAGRQEADRNAEAKLGGQSRWQAVGREGGQ